jgi:hypothetical protein
VQGCKAYVKMVHVVCLHILHSVILPVMSLGECLKHLISKIFNGNGHYYCLVQTQILCRIQDRNSAVIRIRSI